jgi:hypothetical protein
VETFCSLFCTIVLLILLHACWIHVFSPDDLIIYLSFFFFFFFEDEPGKQVRSAVRIKNTSKSPVAFKVIQFSFSSFVFVVPVCICHYRLLGFALKLGDIILYIYPFI